MTCWFLFFLGIANLFVAPIKAGVSTLLPALLPAEEEAIPLVPRLVTFICIAIWEVERSNGRIPNPLHVGFCLDPGGVSKVKK